MFGTQVAPITPKSIPHLAKPIFDLLREAGATSFALFGGALRDAEHNARWPDRRKIKDYDVRIWVVVDGPDEATLISNIENLCQAQIRVVPSLGTGRPRYCFDFFGSEVDLSVRTAPAHYAGVSIPISAVARERAADSDIGISSVAIDPSMQVWARPEYLADQADRSLTVFDIPDPQRKAVYLARMSSKFPRHRVQYESTFAEPGSI